MILTCNVSLILLLLIWLCESRKKIFHVFSYIFSSCTTTAFYFVYKYWREGTRLLSTLSKYLSVGNFKEVKKTANCKEEQNNISSGISFMLLQNNVNEVERDKEPAFQNCLSTDGHLMGCQRSLQRLRI